MLPKNWVWCEIGSICNVVRGGSPRPAGSKEFYDGNIPFLKVADLTNVKGLYVDSYQHTIKEAGLRKTRSVEKGTLLLTNSGATLGVPKICNIDATINDGIAAFHNLDEKLILYFYWFLESQTENIRAINQGAAQPNLNTDIIKEILIPIPPITEQHRIIAEIRRLFVFVDIVEDSAISLEQFIAQTKSKVLDLAIRGKLVEQNSEDEPASVLLKQIRKKHKSSKTTSDKFPYPFEVPESWEWCSLHDIADVSLGKTLDRLKNTGVFKCYLRSINVKWGNIDLSDVKEMKFEEEEEERYSLKYGDLLICEGGEAGRAAVWKYKDKSMRYQNAIHRVRFNFDFKADFYMYVFWHYHNSKILDNYSKGVTIKHLTGQALKQMRFPLPPLAEQKRIVSQIENIFSQLDIIEEALKA